MKKKNNNDNFGHIKIGRKKYKVVETMKYETVENKDITVCLTELDSIVVSIVNLQSGSKQTIHGSKEMYSLLMLALTQANTTFNIDCNTRLNDMLKDESYSFISYKLGE